MLDSLFWAAIVTVMAAPFLLLIRPRAAVPEADASPEPHAFMDVLEVATDPPCLHVVPRDVAEFVIPGFRPGIDSCRVDLYDAEAEFDAVVDIDGVRFLFLDGGSYLEVVFPDLSMPPFGDTYVVGPEPHASVRNLGELVGASLPKPEAPGLRRVRAEAAAFHRFDPAREVVEVWVPSETAVLPRIEVRPSDDGSDGEVLIDGRPAARLCGAPEAGRWNVRVVRQSLAEVDGAGGQAA